MPCHSFSRGIGCAVVIAAVAMNASGCAPRSEAAAQPQRAAAAQTQPAADARQPAPPPPVSNPFGPLALPDGFDPAKARLALGQVPDDPPAPARPTTRPTAVPDPARRPLEVARRYFGEQRLSETITEAEKALRYEPNLAEGHRLIALACLLSGNDSRARLSAERALTIAPDNLACHYVLARFGEKAGKKDDALRSYRAALKCAARDEDRPYRALTHFHLGRLLFNLGYCAAAAGQLEAFEEALASLGEKVVDHAELATVARVHRTDAALTAARARGYLEQYAEAADALGHVARRVTGDFEIRAEYIRMLARARRTDKAAEEASRLLADSQGSSDAIQLLVAVYAASGHPDRAVAAIKSVVARQPENTELWLVYVDTLWKAGKTGDAFQAVRDLLSRHPDSTAARWKLIELHRAQEDWPGWAAQLAELLAADPEQGSRVARELEQLPKDSVQPLLARLGDSPAASTQPASVQASAREVVRGMLLERIDKLDEARQLYARALERTPDFLPAALAAGELYLSRCRWKDAIDALEALQKGRDRPSAQIEFMLARACDGLDQTDEAISHYSRAIQLDRTDLRPVIALARLYERGGNTQAAQQQYQAAIVADPTYMPAREGLIHLLLAQISFQRDMSEQQAVVNRALSELSEMQKLAPQNPATLRTAALVQFLFSRDQKTYIETIRKLIQHQPAEQRTREDLFRALLEAREYEPALELAREIVSRDRCSATGQEMLATAHLRLLQFDEAAARYDRMLETYPNRDEWLRQDAELLSLMRQYDKAIRLYERLLELAGSDSKPERVFAIREKLLQVFRRARRFDQARRLNEEWLADVDNDRLRQRYRIQLLQTDLAAEDYDRYLARCREWLAAGPESPELHRLLLLGLIRADRKDEAVARALEWMSRDPDPDDHHDRLEYVGDWLQAAQRYAGAIDIAKGLLAATDKPERKQGRLLAVAQLFAAARRYDPAIVTLRQLIMQIEATGPELFAYELKKRLAHVYVQADRPEEATRYLNKMLSDLNEELEAGLEQRKQQYQKLADAADSEEDKQIILREFERARKLVEAAVNPRKADILRQMYLAYHRQGQIEVAEQRLREALALDPGDPGICNDLGYSLADTGRHLDEARRLIALAVGAEPTTAAYLDSYGWVLYKLSRFEEARRWLEWGASLEEGEDPVIHDHLADAQWRLGDRKTAIANWKRALEIHHDQLAEGESTAEKNLLERVQRKLEAVESGKNPPLAPVGSESTE